MSTKIVLWILQSHLNHQQTCVVAPHHPHSRLTGIQSRVVCVTEPCSLWRSSVESAYQKRSSVSSREQRHISLSATRATSFTNSQRICKRWSCILTANSARQQLPHRLHQALYLLMKKWWASMDKGVTSRALGVRSAKASSKAHRL